MKQNRCVKLIRVLILAFYIQIAPSLSLAQAIPSPVNIWQEGFSVPQGGRENILDLPLFQQAQFIKNGKLHAQIYPVDITGALPPLRPVEYFFENKSSSLFQTILRLIGESLSGFRSMDDVNRNLGLHPYPQIYDLGLYSVPYPQDARPDYRMGFGVIQRYGSEGFTFSCAACHSGNLFGKTVLGMTNRFPRANEFFVKMIDLSPKIKPLVGSWLLNQATHMTPEESKMLSETLTNLDRVNVKKPILLGLDTSLAQVSLSLNRRLPDAWATPDLAQQKHPQIDPFLDHHPADSKPAVWWNLKYKNRWLSDGSVVSGNPIITNLLWNEIGRGTDLKKLNTWLQNNQIKIDEITAAVFSIEAPRITDFFTEFELDTTLNHLKKGEALFNTHCARCHGQYEKAWNQSGSESLSFSELIQTTQVKYFSQTPVIDVGTDSNRYLGMKSLENLNRLQISKNYGVKVTAQKGYVPPPLVGIWARWPYFHNNSAPSLCAVLTASSLRPSTYYAGAADDKNRDFDVDCNGYPIADKTPTAWKQDILLFNTAKEGLHNTGHDEGIFLKNGHEILSLQDKKDLIHFLQTL